MKKLVFALAAALIFTGCNKLQFKDAEIKGVMTVDKSAMGNEYLEVNDPASKMTRFIHPGKKIISIDRSGGQAKVNIYDGRRVLLASLRADLKGLDGEENKLVIPGQRINQTWDLVVERRFVPLRRDYLETRHTQICADGRLAGRVWSVLDYRSDYKIKFLVSGSQKVWAQLDATGEMLTSTSLADLNKCSSRTTVFQAAEEVFQ